MSLLVDQALREAIEHHQSGQLQDAERLYRAILQTHPNHPDANHNLGVLAVQLNQPAGALPYFKTALEANPNLGQYWVSYIDALLQTDQFFAAGQVLSQGRQRGLWGEAIDILKSRLESLFGASNLLKTDTKQQVINVPILTFPSEAQDKQKNLNSKPYRSLKSSNGVGLQEGASQLEINSLLYSFSQKRYSEAEFLSRSMTERFPTYGLGWKVLGAVFKQTGRSAEALAPMKKAVELLPNDFEAYNNLGNTFQDLGNLDEAIAFYRRSLMLKPDFAEAHNNLSVTYQDLDRLSDAEASCRRAIEIKPNYATAYLNLGLTLHGLGRIEEAETCYRRALQIKPDYTEVHSNLLFLLNSSNNNPLKYFNEASLYGGIVEKKVTSKIAKWSFTRRPERLRVGFVSGDFSNHPVGYFLESMLAQLDSSSFELIAYSTSHKVDELTLRIKPFFVLWKSLLGLSDETAAHLIYNDGIHLLIDLSGHSRNNRLPVFAWKPAPVQVTWLGYFNTTGVRAIDYLIADPWVLPETEEIYFTEKIWRLPETRLCFTPPDLDIEVSPLPAIANGFITFGCFNNLAKMNDDVVTLWARVLATVPESRIFLKAKQLKEVSVQQNTIERFAAHGINADRLILEGFETREKYLASYHRVDIALDPFPYPGGTTTVEGLWMGVPVLTLAGEHFLSCQGVGILNNVGLPQWIATGINDYVNLAMWFASDLNGLARLRKELRSKVLVSPIVDASRFAKHFEATLHAMWQVWCDGQTNI